ncbi:MAG: hypothetical protein JSV67_00985 [Thermoplasmatales archaeon]|nr:MAG: hypothetical protein JSV67_00985 [Thermoplasmatales archaeon]
MKKFIIKTILILILCFLLLSNTFSSANTLNFKNNTITNVGIEDLEIIIETNKKNYVIEEYVEITINLTNNGDEELYLEFCCAPPAGYTVFNEDMIIIFIVEIFLWTIVPITIEPDETLKIAQFTWNQKDMENNQVPDGKYIIKGWSVEYYYLDEIYENIYCENPLIINILKNDYGVDLSCDDKIHNVKPGESTKYDVEIKNIGKQEDTYEVTASSIEDIVCKINGFNADQYNPFLILLKINESISFEVSADVWESVPKGMWNVIVEASSQNDTTKKDSLTLIVNVKQKAKRIEKTQLFNLFYFTNHKIFTIIKILNNQIFIQ